jgi:hypothetical protein
MGRLRDVGKPNGGFRPQHASFGRETIQFIEQQVERTAARRKGTVTVPADEVDVLEYDQRGLQCPRDLERLFEQRVVTAVTISLVQPSSAPASQRTMSVLPVPGGP